MSIRIPSGLRLSVEQRYVTDYSSDEPTDEFFVNLHLDGNHVMSVHTGRHKIDTVMNDEDFFCTEWMRNWLESHGLVVKDGLEAIWGDKQ